MTWLWFLLGAVAGSVANAVIDRFPIGKSWVTGRSRCDKCQHELAWYDLIPLLSYIGLLGKCRYCNKKIAVRNLVVEVFLGIGFLGIGQIGLIRPIAHIMLMGIAWVTTVIAVIDWETKLVSELMVGIWAGLALILNMTYLTDMSYMAYIIGVVAGVGFIGGIWALSRGKAMGFGDVEIAAVMGVWLGWPSIALALWISFVTGAVVGCWLLVVGRSKLQSEIAFGPFLIIGSWIAYSWGETMIKFLIPNY